MATKIVTKNSSTAGAAPTAIDLVQGELAVNVADKRLFTEDNAGAIVELGTNPSAELVANGGIALPDNGKATFGAGDDLQIYHDGSDSVIAETGTGNLALWGNNIKLLNAGGTETMLDADPNGAVTLYYNDVTRLATSGAGISVTGTATMDGLQVGTTAIGYIGNSANDVVIYSSEAGHNGLRFHANGILPTNNAGAIIDADADIGISSYRFKDLHLSGAAYIPDVRSTGIQYFTHTTDARFRTTTGAERMRIDSAGNIKQNSVNTSTNVGYSVNNGTYDAIALGTGGFGVNGGAATDGGIRAYNNLLFGTGSSAAERMRISSAGNVGIGTSAPIGNLTVSKNGAEGIEFFPANQSNVNTTQHYNRSGGAYVVNKVNALQHWFFISGTEKARIDASGNLLVGTTDNVIWNNNAGNATDNGHNLRADGRAGFSYYNATANTNATVNINRTGSDGDLIRLFKSGTVVGSISVTGSATSYNTSSDQRLKDNIADADDAGSKIDAIQVRQYDWKADGSHQDYGMIAQELQTVAPEAVSGDADSEDMMGVDYSKLVPMLIKEIQSLRNRVAQLETGE